MIPLALPPLLQKHIEVLKSKGHVIETKCVDNQICIIFKNYKILSDIWDRSQVDLLVIAHPTYPNVKIDMFWVDPPLSLKSNNSIEATQPDKQCGKTWQRFSWHVNEWNPAHDNIMTYLLVVEHRLGMNK